MVSVPTQLQKPKHQKSSLIPVFPHPQIQFFLTSLTSRGSLNPSTSVHPYSWYQSRPPPVSCLDTCWLTYFQSSFHIVNSSHSVRSDLLNVQVRFYHLLFKNLEWLPIALRRKPNDCSGLRPLCELPFYQLSSVPLTRVPSLTELQPHCQPSVFIFWALAGAIPR